MRNVQHVDQILHSFADQNLRYCQKHYNQSKNARNQEIINRLHNYSDHGYNPNHEQYLQNNYGSLVQQYANQFISLTGGKYNQLEFVKDSIRYLFGENFLFFALNQKSL